jgi:hypothetical protein
MNPVELRVLRPLLDFLRSDAFFFSAVVREMAPMASSLEKKAALTFLIIVYHAVLDGMGVETMWLVNSLAEIHVDTCHRTCTC